MPVEVYIIWSSAITPDYMIDYIAKELKAKFEDWIDEGEVEVIKYEDVNDDWFEEIKGMERDGMNVIIITVENDDDCNSIAIGYYPDNSNVAKAVKDIFEYKNNELLLFGLIKVYEYHPYKSAEEYDKAVEQDDEVYPYIFT